MPIKVLLAITVYGGWEAVQRCLDSVDRLSTGSGDIDLQVTVLDDCTPDVAFSRGLADVCSSKGFEYYRSPRNLGIPRNVNLGLRLAASRDVDVVVISNSDVIYPANSLVSLVSVLVNTHDVACVTAYSNNVSIYSLDVSNSWSTAPSKNALEDIQAALRDEYGSTAVDIPAGISFAIAMPISAVRIVGLMDTIFGRGYCEELDWSLRARTHGLRSVLAPAAFVYHEGSVSNRSAGLLSEGATTVPANEAIIDLRYPLFRRQVRAYEGSKIRSQLAQSAGGAVVRYCATKYGFLTGDPTLSLKSRAMHSMEVEGTAVLYYESNDSKKMCVVGYAYGVRGELTEFASIEAALETVSSAPEEAQRDRSRRSGAATYPNRVESSWVFRP